MDQPAIMNRSCFGIKQSATKKEITTFFNPIQTKMKQFVVLLRRKEKK